MDTEKTFKNNIMQKEDEVCKRHRYGICWF